MRALGTLGVFVSMVMFPWPFTAIFAIGMSLCEPLVPLAAGLGMDVLYYTTKSGLPLFTICGALATVCAILVRLRLKTSIIEG